MRRPALALLLVAGASALDGYVYYQTIEYAACDQEIYQQDIVIHRTTGTAYNETAGGLETWHIYVGDHCREDYGDVRFTNSTGAELAYYLWPDYDSSSARFCVRLEGADAAGTLIVHYGNVAATTTSDGDATFHLFDHFDGTAIDTGKWDVIQSAGLYEDINGNARWDFQDITLFFQHLVWCEANQPVSLFDWNSNGRCDFDDVFRLWSNGGMI